MKLRLATLCAIGSFLLLALAPARAEIVIGAILSETGPGASLGIPYKNALLIEDRKMAGEPVRFVILNDNTEPPAAVKAAQKLVNEEKVDAIIGPSNTPQSLAVVAFANEFRTPLLLLAPATVPEDKQKWAFVVPQSVGLMIDGVVDDMKARGVKTVAYIGFSDAWGETVWQAFKRAAQAASIQVTADERYARSDTSVTAQVLRIVGQNPDAVMVGGSGTPGALPHITLTRQGYKGLQYDNHGSVNQDFLRVGGADVEGTIAPTGPLMVSEQLPDANPLKAVGHAFTARYEARYGKGTANPFAGYGNDAVLLLETAASRALKVAKPGTAEFRSAMRDALETIKDLDGTEATYTITPADHYGAKTNARVMVRATNGKWRLEPPPAASNARVQR